MERGKTLCNLDKLGLKLVYTRLIGLVSLQGASCLASHLFQTPPGGTGRELARKEVEAQPLWPTRRSLKEVAGEAGCSLEAD